MTTEGVGNVLVNDLLSELKLKPWWEEYRGYCFAVSVVAALSLTYTLQYGESMSCVPDTNKTEVIEDFSVPVADFINALCVSTLPDLFLYSGVITISCCGLLLVISTFWLHVPKVTKAFEMYTRTKKEIEGVQITVEKLKALSISPCDGKNDEEVLKVRNACVHMWNYETKFGIRRWYNVRNVFLLIASLGVLVMAGLCLNVIKQKTSGIINCLIPLDEISAINISSYACKHKTVSLLIILVITFMVSICFYFFFVCIGIWKTFKQPSAEYKYHNPRWRKTSDLLRFINTFSCNSRMTSATSFDAFFYFVASGAPEHLSNRLMQEPDSCDIYLMELHIMLTSDWEALTTSMQHYLNSGDFESRNETCVKLLEIAARCTTLVCNDYVTDFLEYLYNEKYFELFVSFLNVKSTGKDENKINQYLGAQLKPNLDTIGLPYEKGRSILYYGLRKKIDGSFYATATERILKSCATIAHVHCNGKSYSVQEFADAQRLLPSQYDYMCRKNFELNEVFIKQMKRNAGLEQISKIRKKFNQKFKDKEDVDRSWTNIAIEISQFKFTPWNYNVNKFAQEICEAGQWEVLAALLNALIVHDWLHFFKAMDLSRFQLDLDHAVNPTKLEELRQLPGSLLYYALSEREYQPFVFTAAQVILRKTHKSEKKVLSSDHGFQCPKDFIDQHSGLAPDEKETLLNLLDRDPPADEVIDRHNRFVGGFAWLLGDSPLDDSPFASVLDDSPLDDSPFA